MYLSWTFLTRPACGRASMPSGKSSGKRWVAPSTVPTAAEHRTCERALPAANAAKAHHSSRRQVGSLGNSCLHLTDDQAGALAKWRSGDGVVHGGGYECDSSYAFHCARVLLNPMSVEFLNSGAASDVEAADFRPRFEGYTGEIHPHTDRTPTC